MTHKGDDAIHETISVDGNPHEIEVRPITLLCHRGAQRIDVPGHFEISPETTVKHADAMGPDHWILSRRHGLDGLFALVFDDVALPDDPAGLARLPLGVRHAVGLVDLLLIAVGTGAKPFLRLPETYLHPRSQTGIAVDAVLEFPRSAAKKSPDMP